MKRAKRNQFSRLCIRMRVLWAALTLLVLGAAMLLMMDSSRFPAADRRLQQSLETRLNSTGAYLQEELNQLAGQCLKLSERISAETENNLLQSGCTFGDLNDDPQALSRLQQTLYAPLDTALRMSKCSGVYAVLDVTANTHVPEADVSRSGLYLRRTNMTSPQEVDPDITFFRGIPDVARQKNIELHNRWNLEFDTASLSGYADMMRQKPARPADCYYWTERLALQDTWEEALLLCVPVIGSDKTVYGMCGADVSALFFMLAAPVYRTEYGPMITVLAPMEDGRLMLQKGLIGGVDGSYLDEPCSLDIHRGQNFNIYTGTEGRYIGLQQPVNISQEDGAYRQWAAALLLPEEYYRTYKAESRRTMLFGFSGVLLLTAAVSLLLYWKFMRPIEHSIGRGMDLALPAEDIEILIEYLAEDSGEKTRERILPDEVEQALERFRRRAQQLSEKQKQQLVQLARSCGEEEKTCGEQSVRALCESMGIASQENLMLYLDFFFRYGKK